MAVTSDSNAQAEPTPSGPAPRRARGGVGIGPFKRFLTLREGSIVVVTVIAIIDFASSTSSFFSGDHIKALLPYFAPYAIMAAGQVFVMTLGEIDLSIGAMYLFTPFLFYKLAHAGIPLIPSVIVSLLVAMALGAFNGIAVAYVKIASFVATLGMLFVLDGVTLVISHSEQVTTPGTSITGTPTFAQILGGGTFSEIIWAVGIVAVLQVMLSFTRFGIYTVAVGGNGSGPRRPGSTRGW